MHVVTRRSAPAAIPPAAAALSQPPAWRRAAVAAVALAAAYLVIGLLLNDPRGVLLSDSGGKVATLRSMQELDTLRPDVGYWAADLDPTGTLHPLVATQPVDGRWIQVTTLPMPLLAQPVYRVLGYRGALLFPALGGVLTAFAARALARRVGGREWPTFWLVGLATPASVYALDFWEHTLGLAAMAWAAVLALDLLAGRGAAWGLLVGALFGVAATMRSEALAFGFVSVAVVCIGTIRARRLPRAVAIGAGSFAGLAVVWLANAQLERFAVGRATRSTRTSALVDHAGANWGPRGLEAIVTTFGIPASGGTFATIAEGCIGLAFAASLAFAVAKRDKARPAIAAVSVLLACVVWSRGLSFVPGLFVATPLASIGVLSIGRRSPGRSAAIMAVGALPIVWATQYLEAGTVQWGSRYALLTSLLLTVAGLTELERGAPMVRRAAIGLTIAMTAFGLAWMSVRTHAMADTMARVSARSEDVVITDLGQLFREGGAYYSPSRQWLTVLSQADYERAIDVSRQVQARRVAVIGLGYLREPPEGFSIVARDTIPFFDDELNVAVLERHTSVRRVDGGG